MLSLSELASQIKSTEQFIEADVVELSLSRKVKASNGSGGYTTSAGGIVGPFRVRLIPQSDRVPEVVTNDGRLVRPKFVLMAMPGTDIQRDDTFIFGEEYQIAAVHKGPEYAFKADVVRRA